MFFLLYRHSDDGVFDDFPKIFDHFPKISEDSPKLVRRSHERCRTFSENFRRWPKISEGCRRLPKTVEKDPKKFRWYTNEFKYNLRDKLESVKSSISSLVRIWKIRHSSPGCGFVWILRVVYFPVKHSCLYNRINFFTRRRPRRSLSCRCLSSLLRSSPRRPCYKLLRSRLPQQTKKASLVTQKGHIRS